MKKKKLIKILQAGTAVLMAGALCGCSINFGTRKEPKLSAVVAHPTNDESMEEMNVTYEMFRKEYKYFLVNSGIEDDTLETVAATCKKQRQSIINYLINERIILRKAKEMGTYDLTEEELKEVEEDFDEKIAQQIKYYGDQAEKELISQSTSGSSSVSSGESSGGSESGETESKPSLTDMEKEEIGNEKLDEMLKKCGMTRDDLHSWAQSSKISEKLMEELGKAVDYSKAEEEFKGVQKQAEELYKSNMTMYTQGGYDQIWLPEGSRLIKHILIDFDDDTRTEISSLRKDGKDEEADKKRAEEAEKLKSKQEEIEKKLDDGGNIDDLIKEYSGDASGSAANPDGYTVIPNGETYMEEFQEAAFVPKKIGDKTTCVTDYGVHIMVYAGDAKISDESIKQFTEYLHEQLKQKEFSDKMSEWLKEYAFEIDYEALRLDAPVNEESSAASGEESSEAANDESSEASK